MTHVSKRYQHYADLVRKAGGKVCPGGEPTVLGIRTGKSTTSQYADKFVVLHKNGRLDTFVGSTRPSQSSSSAATDANGDGVGDVAMIRPGNYQAVPNGPHGGKPSYQVLSKSGSGSVDAWRDLNHDGFYSKSEKAFARKHHVKATEVLFHTGYSGPSSIACQNVRPDQMDRFVSSVGGASGRFSFTLINK